MNRCYSVVRLSLVLMLVKDHNLLNLATPDTMTSAEKADNMMYYFILLTSTPLYYFIKKVY